MHTFAQDARVLSEHQGMQYREAHSGEGTASFDAKWIRQVLLNLLANALKVSPPGGSIDIHSVLSGPSWRVSLVDEGSGVEPQSLQRIFERFVRLGAQTAAFDSGSGLGLAICRSIVELHQGRIWAEPGPEGRGLRVVFELPRQPRLADDSATARTGGGESARHQQWHSD